MGSTIARMGSTIAAFLYYNKNGSIESEKRQRVPLTPASITQMGKNITKMGVKFSQYCYIWCQTAKLLPKLV